MSMKKVPVFVGVTGHRNVRAEGDDLARLKGAIKGVLNEMRKGFDHTEFILLTALAAGADQIAAEAAMELGVRFGVILPMQKDLYLNRMSDDGPDFTEAEKQRVNELIADEHCAFVYTLPLQKRLKADMHLSQANLQFRETARFISDNSFAGIALWDGHLDYSSGAGTGPTVRDSLHGKGYHNTGLSGLTIPETRPIYHIYTPRAGAAASSYDYKIRRLFPEPLLETGDMWFTLDDVMSGGEEAVLTKFREGWHKAEKKRHSQITAQLGAIDHFNADIDKYGENLESYLDTVEKAGPRADICETFYHSADGLAMKYQKKRHIGGIAIIMLAAIAYMCLNIFSDFLPNPVFLTLYFGLLVAAFMVWAVVDGRKLHKYFINYRALAEGLRVQYYWYAAGVEDAQEELAQAQNYYLRRQKGHIEWIRVAIRNINLLALSCDDSRSLSSVTAKVVSDSWLGKMDVPNEENGKWEYPTLKLSHNGQSGYFLAASIEGKKCGINMPKGAKRNALRPAKRVVKNFLFNALSGVCLAVSLIIAAGFAVYSTFLPQNDFVESISGVAMFVSGALPVLAMAFNEIKRLMGYEEDINRYAWYHKVFKRAIVEVDEVFTERYCSFANDDEKRACINSKLYEIGKEALIENAEWVMINEKRAPEVPSN